MLTICPFICTGASPCSGETAGFAMSASLSSATAHRHFPGRSQAAGASRRVPACSVVTTSGWKPQRHPPHGGQRGLPRPAAAPREPAIDDGGSGFGNGSGGGSAGGDGDGNGAEDEPPNLPVNIWLLAVAAAAALAVFKVGSKRQQARRRPDLDALAGRGAAAPTQAQPGRCVRLSCSDECLICWSVLGCMVRAGSFAVYMMPSGCGYFPVHTRPLHCPLPTAPPKLGCALTTSAR